MKTRTRLLSLALLTAAATLVVAQGGQKVSPERAKLDKLGKVYREAKAKSTKAPKDAKLKTAYIQATVSFGTATMNSPILAPKEKYPSALRLYREALKLDPKNKEALANKKTIEDIYRSLGREIPK